MEKHIRNGFLLMAPFLTMIGYMAFLDPAILVVIVGIIIIGLFVIGLFVLLELI